MTAAGSPRSLPELTDGRVVLRAVEERDLPAIDAGAHDPDVVRWIGPAWPIDEMIGRLEELRATGSPTFAICEPHGSCVGMVWINVRDPDRSTGFVGYWLAPAARGRGLATSAVRLISTWARQALPITTIRLSTAPENERSQRVAERSGFRGVVSDGTDNVFELDTSPGRVRTNEEITRFHEDPPGADPWIRVPTLAPIHVVEYDERWPADFERVAARIRDALRDRVLEVLHVGSTSVPGLPAKPVIDVDLVVADPADEAAYVPALEAAGFVHILREPWFHEHRLLKHTDPVTNLHVFGPANPEIIRHRMFHDWLIDHPEDRERYATAKREAAAAMNAQPGGATGMEYNRHKEPVVRQIYERMFRAHGMLPPAER